MKKVLFMIIMALPYASLNAMSELQKHLSVYKFEKASHCIDQCTMLELQHAKLYIESLQRKRNDTLNHLSTMSFINFVGISSLLYTKHFNNAAMNDLHRTICKKIKAHAKL